MAADYPTMIAPVNHMEPVPRRIRATLGAHTILDTTRALYVWEWPNYPQYYIPVADVDPTVLVDEQHPQRLSRGTARRHSIRAGDTLRPGAARLYTEDAIPGLPGMVRFEWDSVDAWFEEDEQVFVHPRNPYTRVDALRSTRAVRVELDGVVLAESSSPVMVFETGLPTRYYLNRTYVNFGLLTPTDTVIFSLPELPASMIIVSTASRIRSPMTAASDCGVCGRNPPAVQRARGGCRVSECASWWYSSMNARKW